MSRISVLFVDDEEELVSAVVERLTLRGIDTHGTTSGREALRQVMEKAFDVVVLDVRMPGLGGLDVLRQISHIRPEAKVILLSGHGSPEDVEEGLRLGAFDYLQKPVAIERLLEIIQKASGAVAADKTAV